MSFSFSVESYRRCHAWQRLECLSSSHPLLSWKERMKCVWNTSFAASQEGTSNHSSTEEQPFRRTTVFIDTDNSIVLSLWEALSSLFSWKSWTQEREAVSFAVLFVSDRILKETAIISLSLFPSSSSMISFSLLPVLSSRLFDVDVCWLFISSCRCCCQGRVINRIRIKEQKKCVNPERQMEMRANLQMSFRQEHQWLCRWRNNSKAKTDKYTTTDLHYFNQKVEGTSVLSRRQAFQLPVTKIEQEQLEGI